MMKEYKIDIPEAFLFLYQPARYKIAYGGRGGGKSWAFGTAAIVKGREQPLRILCAREYQNSIAESVYRLLCDIIERYGWSDFYRVTKDRIYGANGTEFIFKGLHHNFTEIKSTEGVDICWVEEAHSVSAESWAVLLPTIRKDNSEIWITFNPQYRSDPTYDFVLHPRPDSIVRKVNYDANPWFPDVLDAERRYMQEVNPEGYRHVWLGETVTISEALVFNKKFEIRAFDTPSDARFYFGADWGFSRDPSVLVRAFILDDCLYVDHEAWGVHVDIDDLARHRGERGRSMFDEVPGSRLWPIYADSARPETISYVAARGFRCEPADKWQGSIEDGIAFLRSFRKIVIHERCKHAADEFRSYSYKVDRQTGEILPKLEDKNNHVIDALRYALCKIIKGGDGVMAWLRAFGTK
ncbi:MAG: PBSX family phage terminase large subunit [Pyramidobacter sp.]|jgi:phage terminase large subunit